MIIGNFKLNNLPFDAFIIRFEMIIFIVTKSDEFVQSRRFICNTWLIYTFQCLSSVIIVK